MAIDVKDLPPKYQAQALQNGQRRQLGGQRYILCGGQIVDQVIRLKDKCHMVFPMIRQTGFGNILSFKTNLAVAGAIQTTDQGEQGGLAAAGRPQDCVEFALFQLSAHAPKDRLLAVITIFQIGKF